MVFIELLWLIPALPFAGFLVLALTGRVLSRTVTAAIGVGSVGLSALIAFLAGTSFITSPPPGHFYRQVLWTWIDVDGFRPEIAFYLDALSVVMMLVITFVSFMIHLYSSEFMADEEGYARFFAYMNLFVGSMLTLVLADNLLFLYLGWEGVGLCSYLLIGFWYKDPANGYAARKAFVVTRIGDAAMAVGLFLLFTNLGTLQIQEIMRLAGQQWVPGSGLAVAASALLLGGALGKSAQLPLQTWLPDAMAGPTPVSALIHAATMVTAGVYLIARTHVLFTLAPAVQMVVAVIGAVTLLLAGLSALTQKDIKRVLAYSTISQIGYMFLALGVGAWTAAVFHFMTHAFFKALLFLCAGVIITGLHHEHDIFKMGGVRRQLPLPFMTFLIGASSLSALPFFTAGFYSKDMVLHQTWFSSSGSPWLWSAGLAGAFITSLYAFRVVFIVFFGEAKEQVVKKPGMKMLIPLVALAFLSITGGYVESGTTAFSGFLHTALPQTGPAHGGAGLILLIISSVVSLAGTYSAYVLFLRNPEYVENILRKAPASLLHRLWFSGWGFDRIYDILFVRPFVLIARINRDDFIDLIYGGMAWVGLGFNRSLVRTQTGKVRLYAVGVALGAAILLAAVMLL
ncbi:MAG: NADH-quinone oxidoreductase subunit L [Nitrospiraceae bacterium]|nr:MAG: NADH-quinone oxidoreductase subunit L [Nitrospiraceae bacterium]